MMSDKLRLDELERRPCSTDDVLYLLRIARAAERLPPHCFGVCKSLELTGATCTCGMDALRRALEGAP